VSACLYEMLMGERAFRAPTAVEAVAAIVGPSRPLVTAPDVPREVAAVIERGLSRNRDARWPTARSMRDALAPWVDGERPAVPTEPTEPTVPTEPTEPNVAPQRSQQSQRSPRSRVGIFAAGLGITTLIGIVIAVGLMARRKVAGETPYADLPTHGQPVDAATTVVADAEIDNAIADAEPVVTTDAVDASVVPAAPRLYSFHIVGLSEVAQASADEWWRKHEVPLRQKCGHRRSCPASLRIKSDGSSDAPIVVPRSPKPAGCEPRVWTCVRDYLKAHPIEPKMECPDNKPGCEHQVVIGFE